MARQEPFRSKFTMIRSSIRTHGTCVSGWSEWEKRGSRSWLKSDTGSNHVLRNDSMLTIRCNKKMPMNGNSKKMMERQPHWRTIQATLFLFYFSYDSTHPNLEHDSHSTHTLSVILYPHLSYNSHDESHHTSFSHMFRHFLSSL